MAETIIPFRGANMFHPTTLKRWEMPSHYVGPAWPAYYGAGVGQTRDSDTLERSNFTCMLAALGGESETVHVVREHHWAVGWVEWIAIHENDHKALGIAEKLKEALAEYPVIDEMHWGEVEQEEASRVWAECYADRDRVKYIRKYRSQFEFHSMADLMSCARGRFFAGYASELLS